MKPYRIAIVGCGGVSPMHLDGCKRHPERVSVVAACDPDPQRLRQTQADYGIPAGFSSVDEMLDGAEWDAAIVCTPTPVREAVVRQIAQAGKQLLVEKPMADSYEEAVRMAEISDGSGVNLAVDQNFRYHYPFHIAKKLIAEGRIGSIAGILHEDLMFRQDRGWRTGCERHALAIMGIHWLDGFRWMLGSEATSLTCVTRSSQAIECVGETEAHLQITFENGAAATYLESFSSPRSKTETWIIGEMGLLTLGYDGIALYDRPDWAEPTERWTNPYAGSSKPESAFACLNLLLTAVDEDTEPDNSGRDNLKTIALLDGAYRSAETHRPVAFAGGLPV